MFVFWYALALMNDFLIGFFCIHFFKRYKRLDRWRGIDTTQVHCKYSNKSLFGFVIVVDRRWHYSSYFVCIASANALQHLSNDWQHLNNSKSTHTKRIRYSNVSDPHWVNESVFLSSLLEDVCLIYWRVRWEQLNRQNVTRSCLCCTQFHKRIERQFRNNKRCHY